MKKFLALTMAGIMLLSSNVLGATNIFYNNELVAYTDQAPIIINDRTYVPIRDVFEKMGFEVDWDQSSKTVSLNSDYYYVYINVNTNGLWILSKTMDVNCFTLTDKVQLVNGRTMLPLREILEALNYSIEWDAATKSSIVKDNNNYTELDKKYAELEEKMENTFGGYEIDNAKEEEDFTEEEYAYFAALVEKITQLSSAFEDIDDVSSFTLTPEVLSIAQELYSLSCPESLGSFGEEFNEGIKSCATYIAKASEQTKLMVGDTEPSFDYALTSAFLLMYDITYNCLATPVNTLSNIAKERNIPYEKLEAIFSTFTNTSE